MYGVIEGSGYEVIDRRFADLINRNARVERLWTGARWSEGPAWFAAGRYLVWSDIPNDRMLRFDETDGSVSVFRQPAGYSNGNTVDGLGRLVSAEHQGRRITRTEIDGSISVLADRFEGRRFNSPNDLVVRSDETIWFTDPPYGILSDYEGDRAEAEMDGCHVYRLDPGTGAVTRVAHDFDRPNGLAFSPDERLLYIADTGHDATGAPLRHIRRFTVGSGDRLEGGEVFAVCSKGVFDGFRLDVAGRLWTSAGDGVHCYEPDGTLIGKVLVPEVVANVVFGGPKRNRLFICGTTSLYSVMLLTNGAARG